jgi:hypothetical protein
MGRLIWLGLLSPLIFGALICLLFKARGAIYGTLNSKWVRHASDRVAFFTWTAFVYALWILIVVYKYVHCR